jgi:prepilin-type N-terminal cleavage/methylation domain-containing protein
LRIAFQKGFTLLEVMIALAIVTAVLSATFITQSNGLLSSGRNKKVIVATNLARNLINQLELKYEYLPLDRIPKSTVKNFDAPNSDYKYTVTVDEIDFSALSDLMMKQNSGEVDPNAAEVPTLVKMFKDYMQKSVRRMTVKVEWPEGSGTSAQTFTELLVNYDNDFAQGL